MSACVSLCEGPKLVHVGRVTRCLDQVLRDILQTEPSFTLEKQSRFLSTVHHTLSQFALTGCHMCDARELCLTS